jgi:hypothetical protein
VLVGQRITGEDAFADKGFTIVANAAQEIIIFYRYAVINISVNSPQRNIGTKFFYISTEHQGLYAPSKHPENLTVQCQHPENLQNMNRRNCLSSAKGQADCLVQWPIEPPKGGIGIEHVRLPRGQLLSSLLPCGTGLRRRTTTCHIWDSTSSTSCPGRHELRSAECAIVGESLTSIAC